MSILMGDAELREQLWQSSEEYRRLATEHQSYDEQLEDLSSRHLLSEEEKLREIMLKKKKLALKDQMYFLLQRHRKETQTGS